MSTQKTKTLPRKTPDLATVDINADDGSGKRHLAPLKRGPRLSVSGKIEERNRTPQRTLLQEMDAIACGVEAWLEENTGYSRRVMAVTVDIARTLGVPEDAIERWVDSQAIRNTEKGRVIKSLLERQ